MKKYNKVVDSFIKDKKREEREKEKQHKVYQKQIKSLAFYHKYNAFMNDLPYNFPMYLAIGLIVTCIILCLISFINYLISLIV